MSKEIGKTWLKALYEAIGILSFDSPSLEVPPKTLKKQIEIAVEAAIPKNPNNNWDEFAELHFDPNAPDKIYWREHFGTLVKWQSDNKKNVVISPDIFEFDPWSETGVPIGLDTDRFLPKLNESVDKDVRFFYKNSMALAIAQASGDMVVGTSNNPSHFMFVFSDLVSQLVSYDRGVMEARKLRESEGDGKELPYLPIRASMALDGCSVGSNIQIRLNVLTMPPQLKSNRLSGQEMELKKKCIPYIGRMYLTSVYSW